MSTAIKNVHRERINFAKIQTSIPIPNLIEIQKKSYERFLQMRVLPQDREEAGLQSVFKSVFPITDLRENCSLEFVEYSIGNWECKCGRLKGIENSRHRCQGCGTLLPTEVELTEQEICPFCGAMKKIEIALCVTAETTFH